MPGSKYVTILRDPVKQFESSFYYFEISRLLKLEKYDNPLAEFLKAPKERFRSIIDNELRGLLHNGMAFDFGESTFNLRATMDPKAIISRLEKEFNLVLITEYFDEGLVLMMRTFCWSFDDIIYLKQNARAKKKNAITQDDRNRILQWNSIDYKLYQHFNRTFWKKIKAEGREFWEDLKEFRGRNKEVKILCSVVSYSGKAPAVHEKVKRFRISKKARMGLKPFCQKLIQTEIQYINYFRNLAKQY